MTEMSLEASVIREAVVRALGEDRGPADVTTQAVVPEGTMARARIFCKENGVLSGSELAEAVFREVDCALEIQMLRRDGEVLDPGQTVMELSGKARSILTGERVALNFLQHLSGVATETSKFVAATDGYATAILDTRKTVPGLRMLQKYAVRCGGGLNHRIGLYDEFMIKDNHIETGQRGGFSLADLVKEARAFDPRIKLTVEADSLEQVKELLSLDVDQILLDNMTCAEMSEAVRLTSGRAKLEASGNMTLARVRETAATGVDYISVGALTHSVRALDFSLEMQVC